MPSILFGFLSAVSWGAGDFTGGIATRRVGAYRAGLYGEAIGLVLLLAAIAVLREPLIAWSDWVWSSAAGILGGVGLFFLFRSLAEGQMSIAAPVSALTAAVLPVIAGSLTEGLPGWAKCAGFSLALVAIWLFSRNWRSSNSTTTHFTDLRLPVISGLCFGFYFILMHQGSQQAVLWPMIASRSAGTITLMFLAVIKCQLRWLELSQWPLVILNAALDIGGNTFYILSGQFGRMDVAAVLGSFYPGATVVLAWLLLREKISRLQLVGILAAFGAIVLMAF